MILQCFQEVKSGTFEATCFGTVLYNLHLIVYSVTGVAISDKMKS